MQIDGRKIAEDLYKVLHTRVENLKKKGVTPHLAVILVGENPASLAYVLQKQKSAEKIGAQVTVYRYQETVTTEELLEKVQKLNIDSLVHGILVQRPLPKHIDVNILELTTDPQKDIDGFHPDSPFTLPLPLAVMKILEEIYHHSSIDHSMSKNFTDWLHSKSIVVIGKGATGGGPIIRYLKKLAFTPLVIDSKTVNPFDIIKKGDIVISAVGRAHTVTHEMLKKKVVLIGVGISRRQDGKLQGDYDEDAIKDIASYYTPTPGGVGPVNVAMLLNNLLTATQNESNSTV